MKKCVLELTQRQMNIFEHTFYQFYNLEELTEEKQLLLKYFIESYCLAFGDDNE